MAGSVSPLYNPETDSVSFVQPLAVAIQGARETLNEKAGANIHDHDEMIRAAVGLEMRLRDLLAALDADPAALNVASCDCRDR